MQSFQVLKLVILICISSFVTKTLIEAQDFSMPQCDNRCGRVMIDYPFGIGRNCSLNDWFSIDCNSSIPYLSAFNNVIVFGTVRRLPIINVNIPVIKADCKNPVQNTNLVLINKSPFQIPGSLNTLVFEGCGDAAMMDANGSIVSSCKATCGKNTVSDINNCFGKGCCQAVIPNDLESFTLNVTGLERCNGSASLVDIDYPKEYSRRSIVPISLSWNRNLTGCDNTCGEVAIPAPFGIGRDCSWNEWFNVDCNSSTPYLSALNNVEVLHVSSSTVTVNMPMIKDDCKNPVQTSSLDLNTSPFAFSGSDNLFVFEGCGNAVIKDESTGTTYGGCSTTCGNDTVSDTNNCFGVGCCQAMVSYKYNLRSFTITQTDENGSCGSAYFMDRNAFINGSFFRQFFPITLEWGYSFNHKVSVECRDCESSRGHCYPDRYKNSFKTCRFHGSNKTSLGVILGVSISMGLLFLIVIIYALYIVIKKSKVKRRKQRCFKRNGGLLLKQQQETDIGLVDKTILFTSNELEKATDHFNENRILGRGGQGTVYKGMLANGRIVAIKKSKVVDERQIEQFINEVVILSQVNHRNVVKLLGCCLETEVPLLVSEFIPNGTLYDLIQDKTSEFPFSLNIRLQIAIEVSEAVSYLHSATSIPIYHRDIKTTNILLDEKYRAKVSDFGTSRFVSVDQTHLTTIVKGTFGYLDPEYFQSSQFTEKSDVYSFGVVLLELLTREKPISLSRFGDNKSLATHFLLAMEEGRVMSIFDAIIVKESSRYELMAIANLAMRCLNFSGKKRPTMKEVSTELERIRMLNVPSTSVRRYN